MATSAVLGDFDIACEIKDRETRQTPRALGNVMWRNPEAQTGSGVSKASDVYSFGLMVSSSLAQLTTPDLTFVYRLYSPLEPEICFSFTTTKN